MGLLSELEVALRRYEIGDPVRSRTALAHLVEIPDYYTRLAAMEAEAFEEQERHRREPMERGG